MTSPRHVVVCGAGVMGASVAYVSAPATGLAVAALITEGAASSVDLRSFDPARLPAGRP